MNYQDIEDRRSAYEERQLNQVDEDTHGVVVALQFEITRLLQERSDLLIIAKHAVETPGADYEAAINQVYDLLAGEELPY